MTMIFNLKAIEVMSSVKRITLGQNLKNTKKVLRQTLKSQGKKEISFPCIPIFENL